MDLEMPLFLQARCAEVAFFITRWVREATARTIRWAHSPDGLAASRADDGGRPLAADEAVTNGTDWREDKVQ
jgi:hypothetical protein